MRYGRIIFALASLSDYRQRQLLVEDRVVCPLQTRPDATPPPSGRDDQLAYLSHVAFNPTLTAGMSDVVPFPHSTGLEDASRPREPAISQASEPIRVSMACAPSALSDLRPDFIHGRAFICCRIPQKLA